MKREKNYLDNVPIRNKNNKWSINEDGVVVIEVINKGVFNKIAQKFFRAPKKSYIKLDKYGSEVWIMIDDKKDIGMIAQKVRERFKDDDNVFYERLVKFFNILKQNSFIQYWKKKWGIDKVV